MKTLLFSIFILHQLMAMAQSQKIGPEHSFLAGFGTQSWSEYLAHQELKGTIKAYSYSFQNHPGRNFRVYQISMERGAFSNGSIYLNQVSVSASVTQGYPILPGRQTPLAFYVGYSLGSNPYYGIISKSANIQEQRWVTFSALSLYKSIVYRWKNHHLNFDFSLPVFGILYHAGNDSPGSRNDINTILFNTYRNPTRYTLLKSRSATLRLNYAYEINEEWMLESQFLYRKRSVFKGANVSETTFLVHAGLRFSL